MSQFSQHSALPIKRPWSASILTFRSMINMRSPTIPACGLPYPPSKRSWRRRQRHPDEPSGTTQRRPDREIFPQTPGPSSAVTAADARHFRRRLHRRRRLKKQSPKRNPVRSCSLKTSVFTKKKKKATKLCRKTRKTGRCLCQRCIRHRAPCSCLYRRDRTVLSERQKNVRPAHGE